MALLCTVLVFGLRWCTVSLTLFHTPSPAYSQWRTVFSVLSLSALIKFLHLGDVLSDYIMMGAVPLQLFVSSWWPMVKHSVVGYQIFQRVWCKALHYTTLHWIHWIPLIWLKSTGGGEKESEFEALIDDMRTVRHCCIHKQTNLIGPIISMVCFQNDLS